MVDQLLQLDRELLIYLNSFGNENWDGFWLFLTKQINWLPVFVLFGYLIFKNLGWRHMVMILICMAFLIALTDQTTNFFKNGFERLRPCNEPALDNLIREVQTRKSFSFISGHASNSMAAATFLFLILKPYVRYIGFIFLWPLIFAYSRIYLGLHYPGDILCGYIWGILMATLMWQIYKFARHKYFPESENLNDPAHG